MAGDGVGIGDYEVLKLTDDKLNDHTADMYHQVPHGLNKTGIFMFNASLKFSAKAEEDSKKIGVSLDFDGQEQLATRITKGYKAEMSVSNLSLHSLQSHPANSTEVPLRHSLKLKTAVDKKVGFTMDPGKSMFTGFAMEGIVWDENGPINSPIGKRVLEEAKALAVKSKWTAVGVGVPEE